MSDQYIHGYSSEEQRRLVAQAEFWRQDLILPGLPYRGGESLLDIGCGVGAVLKVIAEAHPGLRLHGLDREARQLGFAGAHLRGLNPELKQGDALALPWPERHFDHAFMMWFLEHVLEPVGALKEARRVLKPGGTLTAIECDYTRFRMTPADPDFDYLMEGFLELFRRGGRVDTASRMSDWARAAGFARVEDERAGFDWSGEALPAKLDYLLGFIEPAIKDMRADPERLDRGAAAARARALEPGAAFSVEVRRLRALA